MLFPGLCASGTAAAQLLLLEDLPEEWMRREEEARRVLGTFGLPPARRSCEMEILLACMQHRLLAGVTVDVDGIGDGNGRMQLLTTSRLSAVRSIEKKDWWCRGRVCEH